MFNRFSSLLNRRTAGFLLLIAGILIVIPLSTQFVYLFEVVDEQEVGVRLSGGQIRDIVGPGVYSDVGFYVEVERVSSQAIPFQVRDEEIITADKQRIGLVVSGDIFRPGLNERDTLRNNWSQYRGVYLDDAVAISRVSDLTRQSMKVCVGDRKFDDNIIGTSRDELRSCIDLELNKLSDQLGGLKINNLVVPEVVLAPDVQEALDQIVQSRLATEKAAQDELRELAQAAAEQARQEGEIRIEQSRIQEEARQQTTLAQLEQERLIAQLAVIEAQRNNDLEQLAAERQLIEARKENELLAAERDLEINRALAEAALEQARADTAFQAALAELYATNPEYVQLLIVQANADALNATDKVIFTPEGTVPTLVLPGPGIVPTVDTAAPQ